jgi:hypothetical protein
MIKLWSLWCKALSEKAGKSKVEHDTVALIRTSIVIIYIVTNLFIIAGIIHHW